MDYICKSALVERLGISPRTLENWIATHGFPPPLHVHGSRLAFFRLSAIQTWFEQELEVRP
jgi:predicted DNA-binding transcriptional regulator AlpA